MARFSSVQRGPGRMRNLAAVLIDATDGPSPRCATCRVFPGAVASRRMPRTKSPAHATAESAAAIRGHATARGTARFRERHIEQLADDHFRAMADGLVVGSIGDRKST